MQSPKLITFRWLQSQLLKEKQFSTSLKEEIQFSRDIDSLLKIVSPWKDLYRTILLKIQPLTPELAYYVLTLIQNEIELAEKLANDW